MSAIDHLHWMGYSPQIIVSIDIQANLKHPTAESRNKTDRYPQATWMRRWRQNNPCAQLWIGAVISGTVDKLETKPGEAWTPTYLLLLNDANNGCPGILFHLAPPQVAFSC